MSVKLVLAAFAGLATMVVGVPLPNETFPLATVPGTTPFNKVEPLQQRVAFIDANNMAVSWNTYASLPDSEATVHYGLDPLNLDQVAYSNQTTFLTSRTFSHHAVLSGLQPKTLYHYRVAHTNCYALTPQCTTLPTYTFTTPRSPADTEPYSIAVVADMGLMGPDGLTTVAGTGAAGTLLPNETNTVQSLAQNLDAFEHIIHIGDLAYADYFIKESVGGYFGADNEIVNQTQVVERYEELNEEFYDQITPLTSSKAYMVAVGNHESNCDNGGVTDKTHNISYTAAYCMPGQTNFTAYAEHWNMPGTPGPAKNFWYSYDDGMVHYIILDFETDFGEGIYGPDEVGGTGKQMSGSRGKVNEQIDWLKADLAKVDRTKTPWVLAFGHRPYYVSIADARCTQCQQAFEPILNAGGVDLVMTGHDHVYSRSTAVYNNTADPAGYNDPKFPVYITNGLGGHYDGMDDMDATLPANIEFGIEHVYGWSRLYFANATHMRQDFVASRNSSVLDSFWLYKSRGGNTSPVTTSKSNSGHGKHTSTSSSHHSTPTHKQNGQNGQNQNNQN